MTDRDVAMAAFGAVGALYERLTGERLSVTVQTDQGAVTVCSSGDHLCRRPLQPGAQALINPVPSCTIGTVC